jgi:myo-inositol-1(or 4)-monophosphatase
MSLSGDMNSIVREAGEILRIRFRTIGHRRKADHSLVTDADVEIETMLRTRLTELIPKSRFIGEESGWGIESSDSECTWVVDPIDGTSSFVAGLPIWGTSVALLRDGNPYVASLYFPILDELYYANEEGAAFANDTRLGHLTLSTDAGGDDYVCVTSNMHKRYELAFDGKARCLGSTAYHIAKVACGSAWGAFAGYSQLWDLAGGITLLERVGGALFDTSGTRIELKEMLDSKRRIGPQLACTKDRLSTGRLTISARTETSIGRSTQ